MRAKAKILVVIALSILVLIPKSSTSKEPAYKIGVILSTSGRYSGMGGDVKQGLFLGAEAINKAGGVKGGKIELVFEDDDGNVEKATILSKKMITQERVLGIFGSTSQVVSHPIAEVCESSKVPLLTISPSRSISEGRRFVFITMATTDVLTEFVCAYMANVLRWKRVGILCESTEFGIDVSKLAEAFLKRIGVEVFMEKFTPTDVDVTPLWLKMKERNPDGVYLVASLGKVPAVAMKNRKSLGLTIPVIGAAALGQPLFLQLAGESAEGMYIVTYLRHGDYTPPQKALISFMSSKGLGEQPRTWTAAGWDAIHLFAKAIEASGKNPTPVNVRDELEKIRGYKVSTGEVNMSPEDHSGHSIKDLSIARVKGGKFVFEFAF